ncbi:hypothetical protein JHK86_027536 [Glycine max]|nr:hypothetical protein JHK86_027536 [Glycine max]
MVHNYVFVNLTVLVVLSATLVSRCFAFTDPPDVTALQDLYRALNSPAVLNGWNGNDPCEESWTGVACSGSSVIHLNLSHNFLNGPIGNVFTGLDNLKEMNIQDNLFSGILPQHFQSIPNLWIGGNKFHAVDGSPPWAFPLDNVPIEQNTSRPPVTQANAIENYDPPKVRKQKNKHMGPGGIAFMVGTGTLLATGFALFIGIRLKKLHRQRMEDYERNHSSLPSQTKDVSTTAIDESLQIPPYNAASLLSPRRLTSQIHKRTGQTSRKSFSGRDRFTGRTKVYTVAEVQLVTNSFHEDNLLGEGSLGPVYRAEFPENKVFAVKNINMAGMSFIEEEKFLDVVCTASRLNHPNIVSLKGYCLEHGQHLLVYDYVRNLTLDDALHSAAYKPLSWGTRLRIALGVGQALNYLHSTFSPAVSHGNLKATNVLLDENLMPRVTDCGLAILRPLTSDKIKNRASEIDIRDIGYSSPDHGQPGIGSTKSDIFSFGVLLLELLTGRKPFDGSRPREEQYLAKWASSRLHDCDSLEQMPVKEFRPPMSEIVDSLVSFSQNLLSKSGAADDTELDPLERSFRTTTSRFISSPALSYVSA